MGNLHTMRDTSDFWPPNAFHRIDWLIFILKNWDGFSESVLWTFSKNSLSNQFIDLPEIDLNWQNFCMLFGLSYKKLIIFLVF